MSQFIPLPAGPSGKIPYEPYIMDCPYCGYPECKDMGPYEPQPFYDAILGPPDPEIHAMVCGRCGPFDAGTDEAAEHKRQWRQSQHEKGVHATCDPATCENMRDPASHNGHRRCKPAFCLYLRYIEGLK